MFLGECMPEQEMFEKRWRFATFLPRPIHSLWEMFGSFSRLTTRKIDILKNWMIAYRDRSNRTFWCIVCLCAFKGMGRVSDRKNGSQCTMDCKINREIEWEIDRERDRQTDRETDRQIERATETDRERERERESETERERERDREREREPPPPPH